MLGLKKMQRRINQAFNLGQMSATVMGGGMMTTRAIVFLAVFLMSPMCWAIVFVQEPALTMDPNGVTPLAGVVALTTDIPTKAKLSISDGQDTWSVEFSDFDTVHTLPVLRLKPEQSYTVRVSVTDFNGNTLNTAPSLVANTGPLPGDFPVIDVLYRDPENMEPGYIMMDKFRRFGLPGEEYAIIVDNMGDVVWYSTEGGQDGTRKLPNGHLLQMDTSEFTLLGDLIRPRTLAVPGLFLHHDMFPGDNGNFYSLAYHSVAVNNFPTSETDPNAPTITTNIYTDIVSEFEPDGSLLNSWELSELIDPTRIGYDATNPGFPFFDGVPDWSHSNAVAYNSSDDSIIVSVRHQDAVIKFSRATGDLIWILGPHANWGPEFKPYLLSPVGTPFEWQFHQHAPMITPQGTVLLFDNGNHRASPFDGTTPLLNTENYSRAVEYAIDETTMEVQQIWQYGSELAWNHYAPTQGDADWMPNTGNVLITFTDTQFIAGLPSSDWGLGARHTAIIEVDHASPANKLFDMRVYHPVPGGSISAYRSEKIASLHADDVVITNNIDDADNDGVPDILDNCILAANSDQRDTDSDNFGNICDPDLNNDGEVGFVDLFYFQQIFQTVYPDADFDGDGTVNFVDFQILIDLFFGPPGPSALAP